MIQRKVRPPTKRSGITESPAKEPYLSPPREGAVVEIAIPLSCFAWVDCHLEPAPAIVTRVFAEGDPYSPIGCVIMEPGRPPEKRHTIFFGFDELQWHWPQEVLAFSR